MMRKSYDHTIMNIILKIILCGLLACAVILTGCSLPKSYRKAEKPVLKDAGKSGRYTWRLGIALVQNDSEYKGWELEDAFYTNLKRTIGKRCTAVRLTGYDDPEAPDFLSSPPRNSSDQLDNFALAAAARRKGMNAVLISTIAGVRVDEELEGIFRFKKSKYYLRIQVLSDIYDTVTGAKLSSQETTTDVEVDEIDGKAIKKMAENASSLLADTIASVGTRTADSACTTLRNSQWRASALEVSQGIVTLSAGSDTGLKVKDRLRAYDGRRIMNGTDGERFVVPGFEIGEVEIVTVSPHSAEAKIISADPIPEGSILVPKGFSPEG